MIQSWHGNAKCLMEVCPVSCLVSKQQGLPANSSTDAMSFYRYFFFKCEIDVTFNKYVCNNLQRMWTAIELGPH